MIFRVKNTSHHLKSYQIVRLDHPVHGYSRVMAGMLGPGIEDKFVIKYGKGIYRLRWCEAWTSEPDCKRQDFFTLDSTTEVFITYEDLKAKNGGGKI